MSPLSAERLRVGFSPRRVELVREQRGLRGTTTAGESARECRPEVGQLLWAGALDAFEALLAEQAPRRAEISVVLSNQFVRYVVLPWNADLLAPDEVAAAAAQRFTAVFGDTVRDWEIRTAQGEYGEAGIACAVSPALLAGLAERVASAGRGRMRLASVEPLLPCVFNALRGKLDPDGALAVVEDAFLCIAVFRRRQWHSILTRHAGGTPSAVAFAQEFALATADALPTRVEFIDLGADCDWMPEDGLPVRRHANESLCPLALAGSVS